MNNVYGLPLNSFKWPGHGTPPPFPTASIGNLTDLSVEGSWYREFDQPVLSPSGYYFAQHYIDPLPGEPSFSTTNSTRSLFIASVGQPFSITAWAKQSLQNGYGGVFAYPEQYFDKAYKADAYGNATTNKAGILSEYGEFFATEPGSVVLTTKPDGLTATTGQCTVHAVKIQLDVNNDGNMDLSYAGPDNTSAESPFVFWVNNDYDFSSGSADVFGHEGDNRYRANYSDPGITCQRDLEDFARLWICGMPALPIGYQVTLSMNAISGNPAINLVSAVETNGGNLYLSNTNIAAAQVYDPYGVGPGQKYRTISSTNSLTLPSNLFTNAGNKYFLFEGAGTTGGKGELVLTVSRGTTVIAQTSAWLDLHDVKHFYERAVITNTVSGAISNMTSAVQIVEYAKASALGDDQDIIVFVHGFNVSVADWRNESDTVFKRLYQSGYRGKFATVEWPCERLDWSLLQTRAAVFNQSEIKAYKAGIGFAAYASQLQARLPNYRLHVLGHSQGNAVVSEAIKQGGVTFDTYILSQSALPASAYDVNAPTDSYLMAAESVPGFHTPEWQPMGYRGAYTNLPGQIVNFYNTNDPVLAVWMLDQAVAKPNGLAENQIHPGKFYDYDGTNGWWHNWILSSYLVTDPQESRAMISRSRTWPIGGTPPETGHGVISSGIDLNTRYGFKDSFPADHSAQWVRPIQSTRPYFQQVLISCGILPAP
ncbi:MAG: alpha/beta hydrolase [Verrucomicrobia bacterium]|nr:MAG: alpha/beta hydrolase [Verrucomicrobiota bacterium]